MSGAVFSIQSCISTAKALWRNWLNYAEVLPVHPALEYPTCTERSRDFTRFLWLWIILGSCCLTICPAVTLAVISMLVGSGHCKQQIPGQCVSVGRISVPGSYTMLALLCQGSEFWWKQISTFCLDLCPRGAVGEGCCLFLTGWITGFSAEMFSFCKWKEDVSRKSICSAPTCTPSGFGAISTASFQLWGVQVCSAKLSTSLLIFSHSSDGHFLWLLIALLFF